MADIYRASIARVELDGDLVREHVGSLLATGDKQANRFGVEVYRDGKAVSIAGMALVGYFIRPEADTVVINGTVSGNTGYVELPQSCYTQEGAFTLAIKLSGGNVVQTVRIMDGRIALTQDGDLIDPGEVVPTLDDILGKIAACETAAEAANAAAAEASQYHGVDTKLAERLQIATDSTSTWLDRAEVASGYGLASSRRWFLAHDVPAGATIDRLAWYNMQTEGTPTVQVEVWERVGNKLQKVWSKSAETTAKQTYTVEIGYKTKHAAMVGMLPSANSIGFSSSVAGQWLMVTKPVTAGESYLDPDLTELDTADVVNFGDGYIANATLVYTRKYGVIVPVGLGQEFETIQDAIDSITDDSADNPYTLLLMPSATPYTRFSLQRKLDEERPTRRVPRWISIVGIDKARTIVQSDTGEYESPPAEVVTNGLLKNIIFRMTNDCPDTTPAKGGYAVHFDCNTPDNVGFDLLVEDCDFESATGPAVGIGVHENERLVFRHCRFYNTASAAYKPNNDYQNLADYGCAFAHTSLRADAQNMRITFEGCVGVCKEGTKSLWLGDAGEYTKEKCWFEYTLINNTFWNEATGTPAYYIKDALYANAMNHGNNMEDGYKLIESITLDEDVQTVVRTAAPDGTPYNLDSVYIKLTSPAYSETRMVWFAVGSTDATDIWTEDKLVYHGENMAINTDGSATELLVESVHGVYRGLSIKPTNKAVSITANAGLVQATARKIKAVRVFAFSNTTNLLPSGTKVEIWGCKA